MRRKAKIKVWFYVNQRGAPPDVSRTLAPNASAVLAIRLTITARYGDLSRKISESPKFDSVQGMRFRVKLPDGNLSRQCIGDGYHFNILGNCCQKVVSIRRRNNTAAYSTTDY
jgi:hypothetical protein